MLSNFNVKLINDYAWIIDAMDKYGSKTKDNDDKVFMNMEKKCYGFYLGEDIKAFCCILTYKGVDFLGYTWNDGTFTGKKVYVEGKNYIFNKYKYLKFGTAERYNSVIRKMCSL